MHLRRPIHAIEDLVKLSYLRNHALSDIYLSEVIRTFGISLVSAFETIYLFIFFQNHGVEYSAAAVFGFFGLFFLLFALLSPFGALFSSRFGFAKAALLSSPFLFFFFLCLLLLPQYPWLLVPALLSLTIRASLFWPGFHLLFATASPAGRRGTALSGLVIITTIASVAGPAIGGVIIAQFGYPVLFAIVLPFVLASALPFLLVHESEHKFKHSLGEMLVRIKDLREWRATLAFAASGAEDEANGRVWPLFLFLLAISFSSLGAIVSLGTALGVLATWIFGKLTDRPGQKRILELGSAALSASWLVRAGVRAAAPAAAANMLYGVSRASYNVPFLTLFYDRTAASQDPYAAIVFREIAINLGRAAFLGALALIALATQDFRVLLVVAALLPLTFPLVRYWKP